MKLRRKAIIAAIFAALCYGAVAIFEEVTRQSYDFAVHPYGSVVP